jgi:hypothetical protein
VPPLSNFLNRVVMLNYGAKIADGPPHEVTEALTAYLGRPDALGAVDSREIIFSKRNDRSAELSHRERFWPIRKHRQNLVGWNGAPEQEALPVLYAVVKRSRSLRLGLDALSGDGQV